MSDLVFGIDIGIASCGWAVLRKPVIDEAPGEIIALGSWIFDAPETKKERTPTNQIRRGNRLLRRVIRRKAKRMSEIRKLFKQHRLLTTDEPEVLRDCNIDPWEVRAKALDKPLAPKELAIALGHIAKRRGFKSSAKERGSNQPDDDKKMLQALEITKEKLGRYRTVGELFARDPDYVQRKRNREGLYDRTQSRDDLAHEVQQIFASQRRLGNALASEALEEAFVAEAFYQRRFQDSEKLVGSCLFLPSEKRAARYSPSFERFRLLTRLVNLRISDGEVNRSLTPEELQLITADMGKTAKLSVKAVRKAIGLADDASFTTIKPENEDKDIVARKGEAMPGTKKLREALGERLWSTLSATPEKLDQIVHILSFFETECKISCELKVLDLPAGAVDALLEALPTFARFKGAGHISAMAARKLIPHLEEGLRYDKACAAEGWDHAASRWSGREQVTNKARFNRLVKEMGSEIANPVARKALTESLKQLWAMRNRWGLPDAIHIEMARDVGKSLEERNKISRNIERTTAQRKRERAEAAAQLGIDVEDVRSDTLLRYRLWKEQCGRCPYTDQAIPPKSIAAQDNSFQVDHILPWSRFGDDSFNNKTLCMAKTNQDKGSDTPYEWIMRAQDEKGWTQFVERIESNPNYGGYKKRNYTLENADEVAERFRSRNLNDTRYAARLLAEAVKLFYPQVERQDKDGKRRVLTRPGALTAALRHAWGVESLKKIDGRRVDDARHHALDALIVAACTEAQIQWLTRSYQQWEGRGLARPLRQIPPPWGDPHSFRREVEHAYNGIFVARPERRRARGEGHAATVRQVKQRDGVDIVFERKSVTDMKQSDVARIKDPERNAAIISAVEQWFADGKSLDELPKSPSGDVIRKLRLRTKIKPSVAVRGGTADRGDMVRVDIFCRLDKRGRKAFYAVPIYPHQIMNQQQWPEPPNRAVIAYKDERDWQVIDDSFGFLFSLYPRTYVEVTKRDGSILEGYFQGLHRGTGAISLFNPNNSNSRKDNLGNSMDAIGLKTLLSIKKYEVNRFGIRSEIASEVRTWHGVACTSPIPPG
ncbi:type II CRISPR RNA-guided endonuclease Cas9 [Alterisphingorhabdus coralli]|uniref:CRISPR-associated endonuclease Cas9 n=1 Tax=Alterisphingorhabdus coralli TaxID=3071408 RepID=A0AA97F725_9SPHN|nr:type II CRISPR RNA-guided endonuclease Cas9 [Parasphingorhabdus sp. SCSIO 66989]WOE75564.1 type II CRISPR RNA-guided endonuclease Cas9 [Parasphingorhabdus sp. SCSIO 66989]